MIAYYEEAPSSSLEYSPFLLKPDLMVSTRVLGLFAVLAIAQLGR